MVRTCDNKVKKFESYVTEITNGDILLHDNALLRAAHTAQDLLGRYEMRSLGTSSLQFGPVTL